MKHIVAIGGYGSSEHDLALHRYIFALTGKDVPSVCFLGTAQGDSLESAAKYETALTQLPCSFAHLSLFSPPCADLESFILSHDVVYVGGGNTKSLMALWRAWGLDVVLREAWERGIVLAGVSAGANCWFSECVTDSVPGPLTITPCLGLMSGSCCPHLSGEPERLPSYRRMLLSGEISPGYGIDDGAAVHVTTDDGVCVSFKPDAHAYRFFVRDGEVVQEAMAEIRSAPASV